MKRAILLGPVFALAGIYAACASNDDAPRPTVDASAPLVDASVAADPDAADAADAAADAEAEWYPDACTTGSVCAGDVGIDVTSKLSGITCNATDIWAVGAQGLVVHHDGTAWSHVALSPANPASPGLDSLSQVLVRADRSVWALANLNYLYTGPGAADAGPSGFAPIELPVFGFTTNTVAFWAHPDTPTKAWIASDYLYRVELTKDGPNLTSYNALQPGAPYQGLAYEVSAMHGVTKDELWTVGASGRSYHVTNVDAATPFVDELDTQTFQKLEAVWEFSPSDVWAVGGLGTIRHYAGTGHQWDIVASPVDETLHAMWGASPTDVWAVGDAGVVIHYDGRGWTRVPVAGLGGRKPAIKAIWGASANRVFAVAENFVLTVAK